MKNIVRVIVPVLALLGSPAAFAISISTSGVTTANNLTIYDPSGSVIGGVNDLKAVFTWPVGILITDSLLFGYNPTFHNLYLSTVGASRIGIHVLMDWMNYSNINIDGVLLDPAPVQGPVYIDGNYIGPVYDLVAIDSDGDGIPGWKMFEGPLAGYSIGLNFNVPAPAVPVPAAAWLFGSGLLGLFGVARRKAA